MSGFPLQDMQFWIATLIALAAAWWVVRGLLPERKPRARSTRVTLTMSGKPVGGVGGAAQKGGQRRPPAGAERASDE